MILVGFGVIWGGYTLMWWGWACLTTRITPPGKWPSFADLVIPGRTLAPPISSLGTGIPQTDIAHSVGAQPGYKAGPIGNVPGTGGLITTPPGTTVYPTVPPNNPIPYLPGLITPNP